MATSSVADSRHPALIAARAYSAVTPPAEKGPAAASIQSLAAAGTADSTKNAYLRTIIFFVWTRFPACSR